MFIPEEPGESEDAFAYHIAGSIQMYKIQDYKSPESAIARLSVENPTRGEGGGREHLAGSHLGFYHFRRASPLCADPWDQRFDKLMAWEEAVASPPQFHARSTRSAPEKPPLPYEGGAWLRAPGRITCHHGSSLIFKPDIRFLVCLPIC